MITVHVVYGNVQLVKHVEKNTNYLYCRAGNKAFKFIKLNDSDVKLFLYSNSINNDTNKLSKILKRKSLCQ